MAPVATVKVFRLTFRAQGAFGLVRPREIDRGPGSVLDGTCHLGPNRPGKPGSLQLAQGRPG